MEILLNSNEIGIIISDDDVININKHESAFAAVDIGEERVIFLWLSVTSIL